MHFVRKWNEINFRNMFTENVDVVNVFLENDSEVGGLGLSVCNIYH